MLDMLDSLDCLSAYQFVALNLDRLPNYGPEKLNICSIADHRFYMDCNINAIMSALEDMQSSEFVNEGQFKSPMAILQEQANQISTMTCCRLCIFK